MNVNCRTLLYGLIAFYGLVSLLCPDLYARTDGDFSAEVAKVEKFLTGGMARIGMIALCLIVAGASMVKQSIMGVVFGIGGAFFFYMMKGWINTAFPMIL